MKVAEIENLSFSYTNIPVLQDISLTLNSGDYAILTGENGSGKSTFLKLLLGELHPQQGKLTLFGMPPCLTLFRQFRIGYVPQNSISRNQSFPATVEEIMQTGLYRSFFHRKKVEERKERIYQTLEELGMQEYSSRKIGDLSGGQQQRIMLARALVNAPQFLVLDEPANGVDNQSLQILSENLNRQNKKNGLTILVVTHGNIERFYGANRYLHMENGRITE